MLVKIIDMSYDGNGVAKHGGKTIFIPHTDVGEEVEIEIVKSRSKFDVGSVTKVVKASSYRTIPPCPYYNECGGCAFQQVGYQRELMLKKMILQNELKKVGCIGDIDIEPSKSNYHYRNKIKLTYKQGELGYISAISHDFVGIKSCLLAESDILNAVDVTREYFKKYNYAHLKSVYFRKFNDGVMIIFLFAKREAFLYDKILDRFPIFLAEGEVLESDKAKIYKKYNVVKMSYKILDEEFKIDAKSFLQVNVDVAEKLYDFVVKNVDGKTVINAYSGQGVLSKLLAKKAEKVIGVECQKSSHDIAETIKTDNMTNYNAKVEEVISKLSKEADFIVLDPAREGCKQKVLEEIIKSNIKNIIYISCNFSTLTRDLKYLTKFYKIQKVKIFDMFPLTANMETCVILEKF